MVIRMVVLNLVGVIQIRLEDSYRWRIKLPSTAIKNNFPLSGKNKTPTVASSAGFFMSNVTLTNEEPVIDFSKLIRELRVMGEKLPNWKFLLIWAVFFLFGLSSLISAVRWW